MTEQIWGTSPDGSIKYISLNSTYFKDALNVMKNGFYAHENFCTAIGLSSQPEAIDELEELSIRAAKDGISIIAVDIATNKVIGASFNKIQVNSSSDETGTYFENFRDSCKYATSKSVIQFMIDADGLCNIFDLLQIDCLAEIMFLGTLPECRGRGVGKRLCEITIEVLLKLLRGENVKQSIDDDSEKLPLEPVPKAASAIFTTHITQRIGKSLGFTVAAKYNYENLVYNGVNLGEKIDKATQYATIEYKLLKQ